MSTRSGRVRQSVIDTGSPPRTRKGVSPPRSPARTRKSSPSTRLSSRKSPSRKSPTRKSPGRKSASKNPAPKSPSRPVKELIPDVPSSPSKRPALKSEAAKLKDATVTLDFYRSTRSSRRIEYSTQDFQSNVLKAELSANVSDKINGFETHLNTVSDNNLRNRKPVEEVPPRRSSRLQDYVDTAVNNRRNLSKSVSVSKSVSESISKSIEAISDEENSGDELPRGKSTSVTRRLATPLRSSVGKVVPFNKFEFGGKLGPVALIILIPLVVFSILVSCSKLCSHRVLLDLSAFQSMNLWFNRESLILILSQCIIQAMFLIIPIFGVKEHGNNKASKQCFNAFFASLFTISLLFTLNYFGQVNIDAILSLYLSLALISYIIATFLAIILYTKWYKLDDDHLNQYGKSGYLINDFFVGREIHPYLKTLNVKLWISRISNINTLILLMLIFKNGYQLPTKDIDKLSLDNYRDFISKIQFKPTVMLFTMMQIVYSLYFVVNEQKITSTFYWQSEGVGYLQTVSSTLYPFYFTSLAKYVAEVDLNMTTNALTAALILYVVGFTVMLISNNIKHEFRKNPFQPSIARLNSMPTFHGNKLLVSNLWGIVRHPNYTGDILMHIAFAFPGIVTKRPMAVLPALLAIVVLLHRAWRDHGRCARRYGTAWQRYCKRVPSVLIPKIL